MAEDDPYEAALAAASQFDELIDKALAERMAVHGEHADALLESHHLRRSRVSSLAEAYLGGGVFPDDRLPGVVSRGIDVKLQLYLVGEVVPGQVNGSCYDRLQQDPTFAEKASARLLLVSLHQDLIVKSRILWERIMNLVHFIETGAADIPRTGKRSAQKTFFELCNDCAHWRWLAAYQPIIGRFDEQFRTPEVHNMSRLRAILMRGDDLSARTNEMLQLSNEGMNVVWENVESIVGGGGVRSFSGVHLENDEDGQPRLDSLDRWRWDPPPRTLPTATAASDEPDVHP